MKYDPFLESEFSELKCRGEPYVRPRTIVGKRFSFEGEHKVRPYTNY